MSSAITPDLYYIRRKIFSLIDRKFHVYDASENVIAFCVMKGFKLKEDLRIYSGEDMGTQLLSIAARRILDISATYDVTDTRTGERVGAIQRRGLKSFLRDEWVLLDAQEKEFCVIKEDSMLLALFRRLIANIIPQTYNGVVGGHEIFRLRQRFNPFVFKMDVGISQGTEAMLDRRLALAAAILLCAIEGRQQ